MKKSESIASLYNKFSNSFRSRNTTNQTSTVKKSQSTINILSNLKLLNNKKREINICNNYISLKLSNYEKKKILKNKLFKSHLTTITKVKKTKSHSLEYTDYDQIERPLTQKKSFLPFLKGNLNSSENSEIIFNSNAKMLFEINELLYNGLSDDRNELIKNSKKLNLLKVFEKYQKLRFNIHKKYDINELNNKIIQIEKNMKEINKKYQNFEMNMIHYFKFLQTQKSKEIVKLEHILENKYKIQVKVDKLLLNIVNKEYELENLIEIRNFLLQVKFKILKFPIELNSIINNIYNRDNIMNELKTLFTKFNHVQVRKFIIEYQEYQEEINKNKPQTNLNNNLNLTVDTSKLKINNLKNKNDKVIMKKISQLIKEKNPIFNNSEEFKDIILSLEDKNLDLLNQREKIYRNIIALKNEYNLIFKDFKNYDTVIETTIKDKEDKLNELYNRNKYLNNHYQSLINQNDNWKENDRLKKINRNSFGIFIDLNKISMVKYKYIIKNYKYNYTLLLTKLIEFINTFLKSNYHNYNKQKIYTIIDKDIYKAIIKSNIYSSNEIKHLVYEYCVELLKVYESIIEFVLINNKKYEQNKNNIPLMTKLKDKLIRIRMNQNSKEMRGFFDQKREDEKKIIFEKSKKAFYQVNKNILEFHSEEKTNKNQKIKNDEFHKKNGNENIINMILYTNE